MNALFDAKAQYNALLHNKMADVVDSRQWSKTFKIGT